MIPSAYTPRPRRPWGTVRHLPGGRTRFPLWVRVWKSARRGVVLVIGGVGLCLGVVVL